MVRAGGEDRDLDTVGVEEPFLVMVPSGHSDSERGDPFGEDQDVTFGRGIGLVQNLLDLSGPGARAGETLGDTRGD
jgi:hypothetical protein